MRYRGTNNKSANVRLTTLEICVFILAGGRTKDKWKKLIYNAYGGGKEGIILLNETKLMNEETPHNIGGYQFTGSNRNGKSGKHAKAGTGILLPESINDEL